jgi:predicted ester cyclase
MMADDNQPPNQPPNQLPNQPLAARVLAQDPTPPDCDELRSRFAQSEASRRLVAQMVNALNDHVIEGQESYWHGDMHWYGPAGIGTKTSLRQFQDEHQRPFLQAFSDKQAFDQVYIADGDYVAAYGHQEATHTGDYLGIPATGKRVKVRYMDVWRVEDGKLKDNWVMIDILDFLEQIDVDVPALLADAMKYRKTPEGHHASSHENHHSDEHAEPQGGEG